MVTDAGAKSIPEDIKNLRQEIEKKAGKSPEQLYQEREKRFYEAIQLKKPDRVPVVVGGGYFALRYSGLPCSAAYYDPAAYGKAFRKMIVDMEPDVYGSGSGQSGRAMEIMGSKTAKWPGYNLPEDTPNQILEPLRMMDDEYDLFIQDPTDFYNRYWLPRSWAVYEPLAKLPPLGGQGRIGTPPINALLTSPDLTEMVEKIKQADAENEKYRRLVGNTGQELALLGFPGENRGGGFGSGVGGPAFDQISNSYRGMRTLIDMIRQPDKLLAAIDKISEEQMRRGVPAAPDTSGYPRVTGAGAIHRGSDEFMGTKQWEKFYWPSFKKVIQRNIDLGYVVSVFAEGRSDSRLEYFLDFPKGSLVLRLTYTDIFRAKEIIGDRQCLMGNIPPSLLQMGSVSEVEDYCKKLIQVCGKNGGFIMRAATDSIEDAKPANVKAMVDSVKKWGAY